MAWPKRASEALTDITEDVLREIGLPTGTRMKVCAIDETWAAGAIRIAEGAMATVAANVRSAATARG